MNKSEIIGNYMNWCREYPGISQPIHFAIFTYLVLHVDSEMSGSVSRGVCMDTLGIQKRHTWVDRLNQLTKWGWIFESKKESYRGDKFYYTISPVSRLVVSDTTSGRKTATLDENLAEKRPHVEKSDTTSGRKTATLDENLAEKRPDTKRQTPDLQDLGDNVDNFPSRARTHVITTTIEDNNSISNSSSSNNAREKKVGIGPLKNVFLSEGLLRRAKEICKEHFEECVAMVGDWKESKRDATGVLPVSNDFKGVTDWALAECIKRKENQLKTLEKNAIKNNTYSNNQRDPRAKFPELWATNENGICEIYEAAWSCNYNSGYGDIPDDIVFRFRPDPRIHGKTLGKDDFRRIRAEINNRYRSGERKEGEMASDEARGVR